MINKNNLSQDAEYGCQLEVDCCKIEELADQLKKEEDKEDAF